MRLVLAETIGLLMLVTSACASSELTGGESPGGGAGLDWSMPIGNGTPVNDLADAKIDFDPDVPSGLGPADKLVATDPDKAPLPFREIAWIFKDDRYGTFIVVERITSGDAVRADWHNMASQESGCKTILPDLESQKKFGVGSGPAVECHFGDDSLVSIRDGTQALLTDGPQYAVMDWLEPLKGADPGLAEKYPRDFQNPALEVQVLGPTLNTDQATEIANKV